jgi:hypothetical protein
VLVSDGPDRCRNSRRVPDFGWRWLIGLLSVQAIWLYVPLVGFVIAEIARSRDEAATFPLAHRKWHSLEILSVETALVAATALSFIGRAIAMAFSPEAAWALNYLRGIPNQYGGGAVSP